MRPMYVRTPKKFNVSPDKLLKIEKPLYGRSESGVYWFRTYHKHHVENLNMHSAHLDICLQYTPYLFNEEKTGGTAYLQSDDNLILWNKKFRKMEINESKKFDSKQLSKLAKERPTKFKGAMTTINETNIKVGSRTHVTKLGKISVNNSIS